MSPMPGTSQTATPQAIDPSPSQGELALTRRERPALALLLLLAFGLRFLCVAQYEANHPGADFPLIDGASYDSWGARIAAGDWLGSEVFFQEPLYPYFLGAVYSIAGHDLSIVRLLQCALGAAAVLFVFFLARNMGGRFAGWVAGLALAGYGPAILLPSLLLKPNLFLPLFAWLALLLGGCHGRRRWLWIGVLAGLGALLRGNMLLLLPGFCLWAFFERDGDRNPAPPRRHVRLASFVLGSALVLAPVFLRNLVVAGEAVLTTSGAGTNVYGGNNAENPYGVATELDFVRGIPRYEADDWRQEAQRRLGGELDASEVSRYWLAQTLSSMARDPALHGRIFWNKLRLALGFYEVPDNHLYSWDRRFVALLALPWPGFGLWGSLGLAGLLWWLLSRRETVSPGGASALALLFAAYLATIVLTVMSSRARLPLVILLLPFAGLWLARARTLAMRPAQGGIARLAGSLALGVLVVSWPVLSEATLAKDVDEREYNLAVQRVQEGRFSEARSLAVELAREYPASARLAVLLAELDWCEGLDLRAAGHETAGRAQISAALAQLEGQSAREGIIPRERARAWQLAGRIQSSLENYGSAARFMARARQIWPLDPDLWLEHLGVRFELWRTQPRSDRAAAGRALRAELERFLAEHPASTVGQALGKALREELSAFNADRA
jgi:4-amino-4-deoxy-L-arabinose transferase-like glycosyltransferase